MTYYNSNSIWDNEEEKLIILVTESTSEGQSKGFAMETVLKTNILESETLCPSEKPIIQMQPPKVWFNIFFIDLLT